MKLLVNIPNKYVDSVKALICLSMNNDEEAVMDSIAETLKSEEVVELNPSVAEEKAKTLIMAFVSAAFMQKLKEVEERAEKQASLK